ncbi:MAG: hypothetical protein IJ379_02690 [Lachnospiraceae bacterium]|nr:hypothetical protein [Lachnospiraceae bacterium]
MTFDKFLFQAFRAVVIRNANPEQLTDEKLALAVTANENLKALGYTLTTKDVVALATSESVESIFEVVQKYTGQVKAAPMYPNFPRQVMEMDEAVYRFHQLAHYFSTYGIEDIFGVEVSKGWLPAVESTEKTQEDESLFYYKTLELVEEGKQYSLCLKKILSRKERMSPQEKEWVSFCLKRKGALLDFASLKVPFKQNLMEIFYIAFGNMEADAFRITMRKLCQHTGDVWKCLDYTLTKYDYHFTTSQKKRLVKLLEMYPIADFRANLVLSNKKAERIVKVLEYLSYNDFSRSVEHKEAVRALRNKELKSWESQAKFLLKGDKAAALSFIAARPGMMLRWVAWLLRDGCSEEGILEQLLLGAHKLSVQTLNGVLVYFGAHAERAEAASVSRIFAKLLEQKFRSITTEFQGKKVYLETGDIDLEHSLLQGNTKSPLVGYLKSGMAYKIPEEAKVVRFFTYWNDSKRVDVDLHAQVFRKDTGVAHIGWNGEFRNMATAMSGDLTVSNSAEYIDVDLTHPNAPELVMFNIHDFCSSKGKFSDIRTCFCGLMAVKCLKANVKLYNPKNCFFSHDLTVADTRQIAYGFLDVKKRVLVFVGAVGRYLQAEEYTGSSFGLKAYLEILLRAQEAQPVADKEDADVVLSIEKSEGAVCLADNNFWLDV